MFADQQRVLREWCGTTVGEIVPDNRARPNNRELSAPAISDSLGFPVQPILVLPKEMLKGLDCEPWVLRGQAPVHEKITIAIDRNDPLESIWAAKRNSPVRQVHFRGAEIQ